jgi:hypothetical protein
VAYIVKAKKLVQKGKNKREKKPGRVPKLFITRPLIRSSRGEGLEKNADSQNGGDSVWKVAY